MVSILLNKSHTFIRLVLVTFVAGVLAGAGGDQAEIPGAATTQDETSVMEYVSGGRVVDGWSHLVSNLTGRQAVESRNAAAVATYRRCKLRSLTAEACKRADVHATRGAFDAAVALKEVRVRPLENGGLAYTLYFSVRLTILESLLCEVSIGDGWCGAPGVEPQE